MSKLDDLIQKVQWLQKSIRELSDDIDNPIYDGAQGLVYDIAGEISGLSAACDDLSLDLT